MKNLKQQGFTLIELVMVIVTLGILAAVAIPKFANTQSAARIATLNGTLGALNSAMTIVYSQALLTNQLAAAGSVVLLGGTVPTVWGYPAATAVALNAALNLQSAANFTVGAGTIDIVGAPTPATCRITYTAATSATVPATTAIVTTGC